MASEAAFILRGKSSSAFTHNKLPGERVLIKNAGSLYVSEAKRRSKSYARYTGYPGGLRHQSLAEMIDKKGIAEPIRLAIYGMIPNNKLRTQIMKNLIIEK